MKNRGLDSSIKKIFYVVGGFFVIFFLAVGITIYIAQKNYEPIIDPRYYEKGLDYESRQKEFDNAKIRKWEAKIDVWDKDVVSREFPLTISIKNDNKEILKNFFFNAERKVAVLKISLPATTKKSFEVDFLEKDFKMNNDRIEATKTITMPEGGFWEFSMEIRPESDATLFMSKKLYVE